MTDRPPATTPSAVDDLFDTASVLPPDPVDEDGIPLRAVHDREYRVRAFRLAEDRVLIRGAVRDQKPPGLYIEIDPQPLTIHHMQLDIEVSYPTLEITSAEVVFESHPHEQCVSIVDHYELLVGLSIARGFTHRVRELFGGPRGCTHTTALIQAMAPVAVQCFFSLEAANSQEAGSRSAPSSERREEMWAMNLNTCHVWAEDSDVVTGLREGVAMGVPVFLRGRLDELGVQSDDWAPWAED
ncbi:MAG: DUF2889 domain-containing protein [Acidimicrobiia bacterium]|nr:DUF2889 domain-containing protein [Acidimicrobiia bacterium]